MTDDLVARLRAETDGATVNPDGLEAADRIELLEKVLKRAVDGYNQAYCRDEVNFDWIEDAETALGEENDKA